LAVGVSSCKCCFYLCVALSWILIFNVISIFALFSIDYQLLVLLFNGKQNKNRNNTNKYLPIAIRKQQKNKKNSTNK
jgi:hypothetical protein